MSSPPPGLIVRTARPGDIAAISDNHETTLYEHMARESGGANQEAFIQPFLTAIEQTAAGARPKRPWSEPKSMIVAELNGQFTGHIAFNPSKSWLATRRLYIADISIVPEFRRQGIATELLKAAESAAIADGFRSALALIWPANEPSIKFFRSQSYTTGKRSSLAFIEAAKDLTRAT